jgi:2-polyprenyl-3-methyl-5-hydroxy-6-metoxy-1,4-benzoquinol methylase
LQAALEVGARVPPLLALAVAAYFPLGSVPLASRLLEGQWPEAVGAVLAQQVREPEEELRLRPAIARLTAIEDETSVRVQQQYEENPYPRWVRPSPTGKAVELFANLRQKFPHAFIKGGGARNATDILIAGCGTGQHSIETSRMFAGARVLAVDLSMNSLGYAARKTRELGIANVEYAQADLVKLGSLDRRFDLIESVGVLHHLADPWAGWRVLSSLLRPGGIMRLGFYSALARRNIVKVRELIAQEGYGATADEIRRCRQYLLGPDTDADLRTVTTLPDFFSTSECRDLLFHVQEHRMTLIEIGAFLRANGLAFVGFEIEDEVRQAYRTRFPLDRAGTDLDQWQRFENDNPDTFIGMYQFWVQKAA